MAMAAVSKGRHLRDASFSSYLDTADTDFVRSLAASMHGSSQVFTPSRQSSFPSPSPSPMSKRRPRGPLGVLGVFKADGYFGEKVDINDDHHDRAPSVRSIDRHRDGVVEDRVSPMKHGIKARTPSIRSESSWSSKSSSFLARQTSRNMDQIKPKKSLGGPWFFAGLQCKGSCYDAKQQPVYTNHLTIKQASTNQRKGFWEDQVVQINSKKQPSHQPRHQIKASESTVLVKQPERMLPSFAFPNVKDTQEEDPRKSIEVFGLRHKTPREGEDAEDMAIVMERNLSMLSWNAIPITSQHKRRSSGSCRFNDMDSDASSDLFDIAVFSAEMSPGTAPYEPSEASIEWSVVTASAAEFSAVSDHDEDRQTATKKLQRTSMEINKLKANPKEAHGQRSTASGGILGCRSDKAVKVVAPAAARMASYPPIPPKKTQTAGSSLNDYDVFSPANSSFASKAATTTTTTTTITPFSPSSSSSARAPRAIYMY